MLAVGCMLTRDFIKLRAELSCYLLPMICSCVSCSGVVPIRRASPNRPHAVTQAKSALPPKADIDPRDRHVRFVPKADLCTAANASASSLSGTQGGAQTRRIKRRQAPGREWREVDVPRRTVHNQFAHRLAGRGRVEHAPNTVACRHVGMVNTWHGADKGKAIFGDRPEARLPRFDRRGGESWRDISTQRFEPRVRTLISCNIIRIERQRPDGRDRTHPRGAIGARK